MSNNALGIISGFYPLLDSSLIQQSSAFHLAEQVLAAGLSVMQLRLKNSTSEQLLKTAQELAYLKIHNQFKLIINHDFQVAQQIGADGVHLTTDSISVSKARELLGPKMIIGSSVHSISEGIEKFQEGADYLTFGSIFKPGSKISKYPPVGLDKLSELVKKVRIPVVAVGGIDLQNVEEVKKTGAAAFTGLSAFYSFLA